MFEYSPFETIWRHIGGTGIRARSIGAFVRFLEKKTGARVVYDTSHIPYADASLVDLFLLAEKMRAAGALKTFQRLPPTPDEPHLFEWRAESERLTHNPEQIVGSGGSFTDNRIALLSTLAEVTERNVWSNHIDYFKYPTPATPAKMARRGPILHPDRFAGISCERRAQDAPFYISPEQEFVWIQGHSLVTRRPVWLPAQTVASGRMFDHAREPMIREQNTNGLATRPTREHATLYGALELIERDAYMIMWLNQISLPRVRLDTLCEQSPDLKRLVAYCAQYQLRVHVVHMITDAPTHAFCAVLEDETGLPPTISFGLKAHWNPGRAAEGAIIEALRMRKVSRHILKDKKAPQLGKEAHDIGHLDRLSYWMERERYKKLRFLTEGPEQSLDTSWDDGERAQMERIIAWCKKQNYEFVSVPMTHSRGNATPWHIEMAVIPELQPIHLNERNAHAGGSRLSEIPRQFGYTPLDTPYLKDPHPFA